MNAQGIIERHNNNKQSIIKIQEDRDSKMGSLKIVLRKKQDELYEREKELRNDKYRVDREFDDASNEIDTDVSSKCKPLYQEIIDTKRLIRLLELSINLSPVDWGTVKTYRDREFIMSDVIHSDTCLKLRYVIVRNNKPVNKYDICVVGNCLFDTDLMELPYSYGLDIDTTGLNIRTYIKSVKSIEYAEKYIERNPIKYQEIISTVSNLEKELQEAMEKFTIDDFSEIIEYVCIDCRHPFKSPTSHTSMQYDYSGSRRELKEMPCKCSGYSIQLI